MRPALPEAVKLRHLLPRCAFITRAADCPPFWGGGKSDCRRKLSPSPGERERKERKIMGNGVITDIVGLIEELKSLKAAEAYKFHVCDDSKSFDTAIDCAIETIESFVETQND